MSVRRLVRSVGVGFALMGLVASAGCARIQDDAGDRAAEVTPQPKVTVPPRSGGSVVIDTESDPNGLDPTRSAWDPSSLAVANALFDPMTAFDAQGVVQPYLVKALDHNAAYTDWTITLRPGIRFHDGSAFDAAAMAKMMRGVRDSFVEGPAASYLTDAEPVGDLVVRLTMRKGWASFPAIMSGQGGYVVAPAQLADPEGNSHPIGTGPFKLAKWELGKAVELVRNPDYWRAGLPYLDAVTFEVVSDSTTRIANLHNGAADILSTTSPGEIAQLDAVPAGGDIVVTHDRSAAEINMVMFNTSTPPLDDVRVRRALAFATDRNSAALASGVTPDRVIDSPLNPPFLSDQGYPSYDPEMARRLVHEYEADHGPIRFVLSVSEDRAGAQNWVEQWKRVGIEASIDMTDVKKATLLAVTGQYQAQAFRYFASPDPDVNWHFWTGETVKPNLQISVNEARIDDPEMTAALAVGRASDDLATRQQAYRTVQKRWADLVPYLWLFRTDWTVAARRHVHDVHNVTLPEGQPAQPLSIGQYRLTETWVDA